MGKYYNIAKKVVEEKTNEWPKKIEEKNKKLADAKKRLLELKAKKVDESTTFDEYSKTANEIKNIECYIKEFQNVKIEKCEMIEPAKAIELKKNAIDEGMQLFKSYLNDTTKKLQSLLVEIDANAKELKKYDDVVAELYNLSNHHGTVGTGYYIDEFYYDIQETIKDLLEVSKEHQ